MTIEMKGMLVIGTDTSVGKTYVTCHLLKKLRARGVAAVGMKPVASGMLEKHGRWLNEDAEAILQASGGQIERKIMNPYAYKPFIAPHLAAEQVGERIELSTIEASYQRLCQQAELVVAEGAGGLMTPLNDTETFIELAQRLSLPILLVVAIRLGCINHALLTAEALQAGNIPLIGWLANYPRAEDEAAPDVEKALKALLRAPCVGRFSYQSGDIEGGSLDLDQILAF